MKKVIVLLSLFLTFIACEDDLVFSNPSFTANKNDVSWQSTNFKASIDAFGFLSITAINGEEIINLKTAGASNGTFTVGNTATQAVYQDQNGVTYSTNNIPDPSIQLYPSEGQINIEEFNSIEKTVSGTFYFHAFDNTGLQSVVFNKGFFYNVPILFIAQPDNGQQDLACLAAQATASTTLTNLNAVDVNGSQYSQYCTAYKVALQIQIQECGDDGTLQNIITSLGDCSN